MTKKIILHIGSHKTGSTSIQHSLMSNTQALKNSDVLYIQLARYPSLLKYFISNQYSNIAELESFFEILRKEKHSTILISAERLSGPMMKYNVSDASHLKKLKLLTDKYSFDLNVICYLRKQDSYIESAYIQTIKWGGKKRFKRFLSKHQNNQSWLQFVNTLFTIFGRQNVKVRLFDHCLIKNGDVVADFWETTRLNTCNAEFSKNNYKNSGYAIEEVYLSQLLSRHSSKSQMQKLRSLLEKRKTENSSFTLYTKQQHKLVMEGYKQDNTKLSLMLGYPADAFSMKNHPTYYQTLKNNIEMGKLLNELIFSTQCFSIPKVKNLNQYLLKRHYFYNFTVIKLELQELKPRLLALFRRGSEYKQSKLIGL